MQPEVRDLIKKLADGSPSRRAHAAEALGKIRGDTVDAVQALAKALEDPDEGVRRWAARSLGRFRAVAAVPALTKALEDADKGVRREAAVALFKMGPEAAIAVPMLKKALADPAPNVRYWAQLSLDKLGVASGVD